jgi:hypothetical protein
MDMHGWEAFGHRMTGLCIPRFSHWQYVLLHYGRQ